MKIALLLSFLLLISTSFAQNYNDVAVIINDNSPSSITIGNYFQTERNVPAANMIHISCSTIEEIDSLEFESIRTQVESYLITNNLVDSINYLVTTKGVPLKVSRTNCFGGGVTNCSSLDADLALILGAFSSDIAQTGTINNPYYNSTAQFNSSAQGFYLVTRLDGYTEQDVLNLIDRSGPNTGVNKVSAQHVLDVSDAGSMPALSMFNAFYQPGHDTLVSQGWNVNFDTDDSLLINQTNVLSYANTYGGSTVNPINYEWAEGSITSLLHSFTASTFDNTNPLSNNRIIADLIAEGATAGHGFAYDAYASQGIKIHILMDRYFHPIEDYNLAESYYMSDMTLSSQSVVIGDPKASVIIDNTASVIPNPELNFAVYPNPNSGVFHIKGEGLQSIEVIEAMGRIVYQGNSTSTTHHLISLANEAGTFIVKINTDSGIYYRRVVLN